MCFFIFWIFFPPAVTEKTPKLRMAKPLSSPLFQLMLFWLGNIEAWFCYAEADFRLHGMTDPYT